MHHDEELIRQRAFEIWEAEGRPDGRDEIHWQQAAADIQEATAETPDGDPGQTESVAALDELDKSPAAGPSVLPETTKPEGGAARATKSRKPKK
ncbi:DUF2934 domain-containing protein [Yoonia sp.]|uniref:DUF2934 domain-containing protein n=1 Tax=Yoonia sp. TaxID=2212373 RepID=UPI0039191E20